MLKLIHLVLIFKFLFSFLNNFYDSVIYFINGGVILLFIHRGTVGPLYIPFFFFFFNFFLLLNQFKDKMNNYIIIFISFIIIYFSYYFIFSEVFHPMKIRHHITMIPYFRIFNLFINIFKKIFN